MPFTPAQEAFILKAHLRSAIRNQDGTWSYSLRSCLEQFNEEYPELHIPYKVFAQHKQRIVERFENKNCICKGKTTGRPTTRTYEVVEDVRQRMERSPKKSIRKLSAESELSYGTCQRLLHKDLHLHPYKISVVQQLHALDYESRLNYCEWFNDNLNNDDILNLTFMSDEAWVNLNGYVNSQNYRTWASENPHNFEETPLHPAKIGIWVAMSRRRIIGPIFFNGNINAERYRLEILDTFLNELHDDELRDGYFQQDGATAHTANETIRYLQQFYDDRLISRGVWPARSPDLTPLDFFLFPSLKNNIFRNPPHTLEELQEVISQEIANITPATLERVFDNIKRRVQLCGAQNGGHFEQLL